jgi:hypothetical protein
VSDLRVRIGSACCFPPPFLGEADIEFDVPYLEAMDSLSFGYAVNPSLRACCKGDCPPCASAAPGHLPLDRIMATVFGLKWVELERPD